MFGPFGGFEIIVLLALGLLIFGPRKLPEIGRSIGRVVMEFRRAANELKTSIEREIDLEEVREASRSIHREVDNIRQSVTGEVKRTLDDIDREVAPDPSGAPAGGTPPGKGGDGAGGAG